MKAYPGLGHTSSSIILQPAPLSARGGHRLDTLRFANGERQIARLVERGFGAGIAPPRPHQAEDEQRWNTIGDRHPGDAEDGGGGFPRRDPIALIEAQARLDPAHEMAL